MKFRTFMFSLIALSFIATTCAENIEVHSGGSYGKESVESITGSGMIKLNGTEITKTLEITGSLIARDASIEAMDILGQANLTESHVKNANVMGQIQAVRSTFENPITILSQKAVFTESKLKGINVKKDSSYKGKQIIELRRRTIVNGNIHFESGKGEVHLFPGSQVLGLVDGGKIVKKN